MSVLRAKRRAACALAAGSIMTLAGCVDGDLPPRPDEFGDGAGLVTLARGSGCGSIHLVASAGRLYWTEQDAGNVKSVSTEGGAVTTIAAGQVKPGALAVDSASIFWVAGGLTTIMKKSLVGDASVFVPASMAPEMFGDENRINALLADSSTLYFGRFTFAFKVPTTGGTPKVLMQSPSLDQGRPAAFALDSTHLYQTEDFHWAVTREKLDGTQEGKLEDGAMAPFAPDRIASSQSSLLLLDAIAVVDNRVIWAAGSSIESKPVDASEGEEATVITSTINGNDVTGFVVTGNDVYFGEAGTDTVERASLQGGIATIVVTGQSHPTQFVADDQNVYWATADCKIRKRAKP